jgi:hypothetical protein
MICPRHIVLAIFDLYGYTLLKNNSWKIGMDKKKKFNIQMTERVITEHQSKWPCQIKDCKNLPMKMRKYDGSSGLNCQEHSICGNCDLYTNGWTCNICEPCDERMEKARKAEKEADKKLKGSLAKLSKLQ